MNENEHDNVIRQIVNKHLKEMREELNSKGYSITSHFRWEPRRYPKAKNQS